MTINNKQWIVSVATTLQELVQGLGGMATIPSGTGMLFDMGQEQRIMVTTVPMRFPLDIVFLDRSLVVNGIAVNVAPGHIVTGETPARFFLEVNAGEAQGVKKEQQAILQILSNPGPQDNPQLQINQLTSLTLEMMADEILGFLVFGMGLWLVIKALTRGEGQV